MNNLVIRRDPTHASLLDNRDSVNRLEKLKHRLFKLQEAIFSKLVHKVDLTIINARKAKEKVNRPNFKAGSTHHSPKRAINFSILPVNHRSETFWLICDTGPQ